ncbi:DUF2273 domain-containing protein [Leucobacter luti]|uniref:Small integral membrane protein DUF2273 n=1 Tax=Leucobacter luti TaxID=340320 RepID=A0A4R6S6A2_9MICO|nr:DUF2273 domain-containing protein [Leucobacter luti]MCW2287088.1 L-cysteine desulfidase [Leucobacter luti]QYM76814.1 DUF2273 domain-containing protein [Leucobacter luti]TCK41312.1 small integral membrane protein DUF2273 [Leucobacter luti]TDP94295.1 small integral membrane protein DUF2273 [Leucobacter luti]
MSSATTGAAVGAVLGLTWIIFGFWAAVLIAVLMLIGATVGRVIDGRIDVRALADVFRGRRSSL